MLSLASSSLPAVSSVLLGGELCCWTSTGKGLSSLCGRELVHKASYLRVFDTGFIVIIPLDFSDTGLLNFYSSMLFFLGEVAFLRVGYYLLVAVALVLGGEVSAC